MTAASPNAHSVLPAMLAEMLDEQIEVAHLPVAPLDPAKNFVQPVRAFTAGRALAARLVTVEVQQVLGEPHHAGRVVEHDDAGRSEQRSGFCTPSKLACVSSWSGSRIGTDDPPGMTALSVRPSRTPPAWPSISSRSVMSIDAS